MLLSHGLSLSTLICRLTGESRYSPSPQMSSGEHIYIPTAPNPLGGCHSHGPPARIKRCPTCSILPSHPNALTPRLFPQPQIQSLSRLSPPPPLPHSTAEMIGFYLFFLLPFAEQVLSLSSSTLSILKASGIDISPWYNAATGSASLNFTLHDARGLAIQARHVRFPSTDDVVCQTTLGSPRELDAAVAVDKLWADPNYCCQEKKGGGDGDGGGRGCTGMKHHRSAVVGVCGDYRLCMQCKSAAYLLSQILSKCPWSDRVGGYYVFNYEGTENRYLIYWNS